LVTRLWTAAVGRAADGLGTEGTIAKDDALRACVRPALRADIMAGAQYEWPRHPRLDIPLVALGGRADAQITPAQLADWAKYSDDFRGCYLSAGGHFWLDRDLALVARAIGQLRSAS
jgi:medium-chain acyl-[acyl-carrier-protein] hydrolase